VIGGDVIWPAQFAGNGYISDLSDRFKDSDEFLPGPMEAMKFEDGIFGVPWYTDAGLLYYRKDLLEKAGFSEPPKTWDELRQQAQKVMQDEGTKFGFVFQGAEYEGGVCNGLEYVWTHGGDVLDPNDPSKVVVESPESVAALTTERAMIEDGVTTRAVLQFMEDQSHGAFVRGDSVFLRNWPYVYALLSDPKESEIKPDQVGIAAIPTGGAQSASALGGWNFLVNAASEKQDQAWEFIQWMTAPEQLKRNALEGSKLPVRRELYEDQDILDKVPVARLGKNVIIDNSRPRPVSPLYSDISLEMAEKFNASLAGEMSPEDAVATLQKEVSNIVKQQQ
jgi:multiple sugar transport system substrate-binding protein